MPFSEGSVAITNDEKQSNDAEIGAVLTARAIVQSMEVEEQYDSLRPNPRSSSSRRNQLKSHAESYLQSSPHSKKSQEQLVQSLKGAKLRSWIVQVPPTFPDEGMWTSFDASLHYLARYFDQHGPVRRVNSIECDPCLDI